MSLLSCCLESVMSTKHTLKLCWMLDMLIYFVTFWCIYYSHSNGESKTKGIGLEKWVQVSLTWSCTDFDAWLELMSSLKLLNSTTLLLIALPEVVRETTSCLPGLLVVINRTTDVFHHAVGVKWMLLWTWREDVRIQIVALKVQCHTCSKCITVNSSSKFSKLISIHFFKE